MPLITRSRLALAVVAALTASLAAPAFAQDAAAPAVAQDAAAQAPPQPAAPAPSAAAKTPVELDRLVVTGTRVQGRSPRGHGRRVIGQRLAQGSERLRTSERE